MTNLARILVETADRHPDSVALRLDDFEMSYLALDAACARLAGLLVARGLRPGDRVGVMLPNVPYFAIAYYGVLRAGGHGMCGANAAARAIDQLRRSALDAA